MEFLNQLSQIDCMSPVTMQARRLPQRAFFLFASLFLAGPLMAQVAPSKALVFSDDFNGFNANTWSCEYSCPTVFGGIANFQLRAGVAPNNEGSWSKIRYGAKRFTSGSFKVRFALSARPNRAVWWGMALWDDGPSADGSRFNEINFGYTTNQSFTSSQLYFESAKLGKSVSIKIDTKVDLYDGKYHDAELEYDRNHVSLYFDGVLMHTINDTSVIPTDPMDLIIGPRLVSGSAALTQDFTQYVDSAKIYELAPASAPAPTPASPAVLYFNNTQANSVLQGNVHVSAFANDPDAGTAADGAGIASVRFELIRNGRVIASRDEYQAPYDWYFDTRNFRNGAYTLRAKGTSTAATGGGQTTVSVPVTLSNR